MDIVPRTPLVDAFRRSEVAREVRLSAARGVLAPRAAEQLALLVLLCRDEDREVSQTARATLDRIAPERLQAAAEAADVPSDVREFLHDEGLVTSGSATLASNEQPLFEDAGDPLPEVVLDEASAHEAVTPPASSVARPRPVPISTLSVVDKLKLAMRGSREQRALLIRDPNKLVAMAVLSSPKLSENEVEGFARMPVVAEDVLRVIASNRVWMRNYAILASLVRNPKTPPAVAMPLVPRLNERDLRGLSVDRNVPETLRITARKLVVAAEARRK
jgi:hypothetical protein